MHLLVCVRGIKHEVDRMITELQGKKLPFHHAAFITPENPEGLCLSDFHVRPIQLYEFVFPEEDMNEVLHGIPMSRRFDSGFSKVIMNRMRKMLGYDELPDMKTIPAPRFSLPFSMEHVDVMGIGIKKDRFFTKKDYANAPILPQFKAAIDKLKDDDIVHEAL